MALKQNSPVLPAVIVVLLLAFLVFMLVSRNERQGHPNRDLQHRILKLNIAETSEISRPCSGPNIMNTL